MAWRPLVLLLGVPVAFGGMLSMAPTLPGMVPSVHCTGQEMTFCEHERGKCRGRPQKLVRCSRTSPSIFNTVFSTATASGNVGVMAPGDKGHFADLDGDGDLDLLFGREETGEVKFHERLGDDVWETTGRVLVNCDNPERTKTSPWVADWNGDGLMDIIAQNYVFLRDNRTANLTFLPKVELVPKSQTDWLVFAVDWDNDGDLDLIYGGILQSNRGVYYHERQPDGSLQYGNVKPFEGLKQIHPVDWDGDGDLDVLSFGHDLKLYERLDDGSLSELAGTANPFGGFSETGTYYSRVVQAIDIDGDGDKDLVVWINAGNNRAMAQIYERVDGSVMKLRMVGAENPLRAVSVGLNSNRMKSYKAVDFDGDGDLDLIIYERVNKRPIYWERRGSAMDDLVQLTASASPLSGMPQYGDAYWDVADDYVDWDGDGLVDVLRATPSNEVHFWKHFANGTFVDQGPLSGVVAWGQRRDAGDKPESFRAIDFNKDGLLDIVAEDNLQVTQIKLYLRNADDTFNVSMLQGIYNHRQEIHNWIPDWNGDGRWDVLHPRERKLYLQTNVSGVFEEVAVDKNPIESLCVDHGECPRSIVPADWDGDGDLDLLVENPNRRIGLVEAGRCDDARVCNNKGLCNGYQDTCSCIGGYENSDCSGCQAGYYSAGHDPVFIGNDARMCSKCPEVDSRTCSRRGVCSDDAAARLGMLSDTSSGFGSGRCHCNDNFTGTACELGSCPDYTEERLNSSTGLSECQPCPVCPQGHSLGVDCSCTPCSPGTAPHWSSIVAPGIPSGPTSCQACGSGTFAPALGVSCQQCPSGQVPAAGLGSCRACAAGSAAASGDPACTSCTSGKFALASSPMCEPCPSGSVPADDRGSCVVCPAGRAAENGITCTPCASGNFAPAGSSACRPCPGGNAPADDRGSCAVCATGSAALSGDPACTNCTSGKYAPANSPTCEQCPNGRVPADDRGSCQVCGAGSAAVSGDSACTPCTGGRYAQASSLACEQCPSGSVPAEDLGSCRACAAGSAAELGASACAPCAGGKFAAASSPTCELCPGGQVPANDGGSCVPCATGTAAVRGDSACTPCPPGTFAQAASGACTPCQSGSFAAGASDACIPCELGYVSSVDGSSCQLSTASWAFSILIPLGAVGIILGWCLLRYMRYKTRCEIDDATRKGDSAKLHRAIESGTRLHMSKAILQDAQSTLDVCQNKYIDSRFLLEVVAKGDLRLIKGSWLVDQGSKWRFRRQQDLPPEAFWTVEDLRAQQRNVLFVAISYCWLHPVHPDPESKHFALLHRALRLRLQVQGPGKVEDIAVFLDFCSLTQKGETGALTDPKPGVDRDEQAKASFGRGLKQVNIAYANQLVEVWMLQWVPEEHTRKYMSRGWPFFEQAVSGLITDSTKLLNVEPSANEEEAPKDWLQLYTNSVAGRRPPMTPDRFEQELKTKSFTNGKTDESFVVTLYKRTFEEVVGTATVLWFTKLNWVDKDAEELAHLLPNCQSLQHIYLGQNSITAEGAIMLAKAAKDCPNLRGMDLYDNAISGNECEKIFRQWEESGKSLSFLRLGSSDHAKFGPNSLSEDKAHMRRISVPEAWPSP